MLLAIDFDGTLAVQDTVDWLSEQYAPEVFRAADAALARGEIGLDECMSRQVAPITADEAEVVDLLVGSIEFRPGIPELLAFCAERGVEPIIVSAGFENLMRPMLDHHGYAIDVSGHLVDFGAGGMRIRFRPRALCDLCGERCKRDEVRTLAAGRRLAYVGDGHSDLCAAEVADLRFARHNLARHLAAKDLAFTPFEDFHDVREGLARHLAGTGDDVR
jgi:2-hydroxy-3-keto-5-methylthiopentenyl-1-phosphate phosphatase